MIDRRTLIAGAALGLAGCSGRASTYSGPEVTRIQVFKASRTLQLIHDRQLLKQYQMQLGFAPLGHKEKEGDGRTPEGAYYINRKNPRSAYHLSLGISYPSISDVARARAAGVDPGGDIFIHGTPQAFSSQKDWTWGCIAVTNAEMEEIYPMVKEGTKIFIYA